ncbi:hypothetical protein F5Y18DRAFT_386848 [Xylariaceae sp. FL1019]|nr:hypothetical protein F5Y18DRAFT_386848 [Xylariaceae sp. FL1019]
MPTWGRGNGINYELLPRHFHCNPMESCFAREHFSNCHFTSFPGGIAQMVQRAGKVVRMGFGKDAPCPDQWLVSGHNMSVQNWYARVYQEWDELRRRHPSGKTGERIARKLDAPACLRTVDAYSVTGRTVIAGGRAFAVFCTHPNCDLQNDLPVDEAAQHFETHGLSLTEADIIAHFGYTVVSHEQPAHETPSVKSIVRYKQPGVPTTMTIDTAKQQQYQSWDIRELRAELDSRGLFRAPLWNCKKLVYELCTDDYQRLLLKSERPDETEGSTMAT